MEIKSSEKQYKTVNHRVFSCQYHVIFCPKYRRKVLIGEVETRLKEVLRDTAARKGFDILEMEVMPDHVHLLLDVDPEIGVINAIRALKSRSAHTLRSEFPYLKRRIPTLWTRSYFVSSVGAVSLEVVKRYIEDQKKV